MMLPEFLFAPVAEFFLYVPVMCGGKNKGIEYHRIILKILLFHILNLFIKADFAVIRPV